MTTETSTIATTAHMASRRWLSPALFALIGLAFLLPFATVSCDNAATTFTGVQLVAHAVPQGGSLAGDEYADCHTYIGTCVEHSASGIATLALVAALVGLALGLCAITKGPGWCASIGLGAMVALPFQGGILGPDVTLRLGYDLAFWVFVAVGLLHARRAWVRRKRRRGAAPARRRHLGTSSSRGARRRTRVTTGN